MCVKICIVPKMFRTKHFQSFQNIKTWRNWACIRTYQKHFKLKINWKMMFYFKNMLNILFNFTLDKIRVNVIYSTSACSICQCHIENAYDYRQHHKKKIERMNAIGTARCWKFWIDWNIMKTDLHILFVLNYSKFKLKPVIIVTECNEM